MHVAPKFTGKERDTESGNDYFGARYYESSMGRFTTPDPSGLYFADPTNPQSLNLYEYALNDPLRFIDPHGLDNCTDANGNVIPDDQGGDNDTNCANVGGTWNIFTPSTNVSSVNGNSPNSNSEVTTYYNGYVPQNAPKPCSVNGGTIYSASATTSYPTEELGAAIGGVIGDIPGALIGDAIGSMFGVGVTGSYVPQSHSLYFGVTATVAPFQMGGGSGFSASVTPVPSGQNPDAIANGTSYSATFQPDELFGSVVTKSPGSGPPVVGYSIGSRAKVAFGASHSWKLFGGGC